MVCKRTIGTIRKEYESKDSYSSSVMTCTRNNEHHQEFVDSNQRENAFLLMLGIRRKVISNPKEEKIMTYTTNCEHHKGIDLERKEHNFPFFFI